MKIPTDLFANNPDIRIVGYIYETNRYDLFKKMKHNRIVTQKRKELLKKSYEENEILTPLTCNEKMEIADGQGRYECKRELNRPIQFVVSEGATTDDCRRINRCNTPWEISDYVYSYADEGNENYIKIQNLNEELKISFTRIMRLSNKGTHTHIRKNGVVIGNNDILKSGKLIFTDDDCYTVRTVVDKCSQILDALCFEKRTNENFWVAVKIMVETSGYDHDRMLNCCKKNRSSYVQMGSLTDQLKEFSRIYNYRNSKNKLYFEDYMRNKGYEVRDYTSLGGAIGFRSKEDIGTLDEI